MRYIFRSSLLPLVFCVAFIFGLILSMLCAQNPALFDSLRPYFAPAFILAALSVALSFVPRSPLRVLFVFIAGLLFGFLRASPLLLDQLTLKAKVDQTVTLSGTLLEDPVKEEGKVKVTISSIILNYSTKSYNSQAYLLLSSSPALRNLSRSDRITVRGVLKPGFVSTPLALFRPEVLSLGKPDPPDYSLRPREAFSAKISEAIPDETESKLAMGYLLGQKSSLPTELNDALKRVGLPHAVVASGYNLSILVGLAKRRMGKISRALSLFVALFLLATFVSVVGLSPSMLRAALVSSLSLLAWYFGRKFHPVRLLLYAATLSLLASPNYLLNLGWQLSFASFAGIMLLGPIFTRYLYRRQDPPALAAALIETLAAQLSCLPLTLANFGSFSGVGLFANLLVVPTIPLVMLLSFLTGVLSFINLFPPLAAVTAQLSSFLLSFHLKTINILAALPWASYDFPAPNHQLLFLYLPLVFVAFCLFRRANFSFRPLLAKTRKDGKIYAC